MHVPYYPRGVVVAFTEQARREVLGRFGQWDVVLTWEECQAWAAGVDAVGGAETDVGKARSLEALAFFAARQGLNPVP